MDKIYTMKSINLAKVFGAAISVKASRGCPQGGVLSPLLQFIAVDDLMIRLNTNVFQTLGYADHLVDIIRCKHEQILTQPLQETLNHINE